MKPVGEPYAGNPHVRFDERGWETERCRMAQATAPILDSTIASEAKALNLRQLLGEQRKCMDGRPRLPSTLLTHSRTPCCIAQAIGHLSDDSSLQRFEART
jgi:hypothetical protein